ncbi:TPA: VanZ family protein [Streptococcus suis]|uniref:VanZ family protein n=1 Tax=Streptococcus suis TaxID=1307 RepID=UPI0005CCCE19|nr:VanZ family protein [Streptococcus suis]NQR01934.1 VanZ family protein [Streptococcus suis]NQR73277.1 VanZ family protein [Streptococcus suis]CYX50010.1 glycopeptide antibiotics resistance protein [Streptococcus suis]HEM5621949.1 VanZ family protein [Streptococcus suis]HEM5652971.1 VanZ family protein [Streptococcus suis]
MRKFFQADGNLTKLGRQICKTLAGAYALAIVLLCFLPQTWYLQYKDFSTPGIIQIGRLYLLPTPFNSIVNGDKVDSLADLGWIFLQNITNIFLLFPLIFLLLFLREEWRSLRAVIRYSFCISLFIECTQLLLDLLIDAQRVFEIDDLWTNTMGGILAYFSYSLIKRGIILSKQES